MAVTTVHHSTTREGRPNQHRFSLMAIAAVALIAAVVFVTYQAIDGSPTGVDRMPTTPAFESSGGPNQDLPHYLNSQRSPADAARAGVQSSGPNQDLPHYLNSQRSPADVARAEAQNGGPNQDLPHLWNQG